MKLSPNGGLGPARAAARTALGLAMLLCPGLLLAAGPPPVALPPLPVQAASVADFLSAGWHIAQQFQADFNRDGRQDALLQLQPATPGGAAGDWSPPVRLLLLLRSETGWQLAEHNDSLVPRVDLSSQEDPMANGEITLQPGGFVLSLGMAATVGSYQMATLRYSFRHDGRCLRLVRYERLELHRGTLDTRDLAIDYLTGAVLHSSGNAQTDVRQQRRARLPGAVRLCLRDLGDAARFKPL